MKRRTRETEKRRPLKTRRLGDKETGGQEEMALPLKHRDLRLEQF